MRNFLAVCALTLPVVYVLVAVIAVPRFRVFERLRGRRRK